MSLELAVEKLAASLEKLADAQLYQAKVLDVTVGIALKNLGMHPAADTGAAATEQVKAQTQPDAPVATPESTPAEKPKSEPKSEPKPEPKPAAKSSSKEKPQKAAKSTSKLNGAAPEESSSAVTRSDIQQALTVLAKSTDKETAKAFLANFKTEDGTACQKVSDVPESEYANFLSKLKEQTGQ